MVQRQQARLRKHLLTCVACEAQRAQRQQAGRGIHAELRVFAVLATQLPDFDLQLECAVGGGARRHHRGKWCAGAPSSSFIGERKDVNPIWNEKLERTACLPPEGGAGPRRPWPRARAAWLPTLTCLLVCLCIHEQASQPRARARRVRSRVGVSPRRRPHTHPPPECAECGSDSRPSVCDPRQGCGLNPRRLTQVFPRGLGSPGGGLGQSWSSQFF